MRSNRNLVNTVDFKIALLWQLFPFPVTTLCLTSFGGLLCMTIGDIWLFKRRSPLETRKVALDNLILQSIPCHQAFSIPHSTGNFCTVYLILHSFMLHSWTYSSVSFFFKVVVGERIRPSLYNVSNSFYLRSCLDDFMFIWAIHQLISGYIY